MDGSWKFYDGPIEMKTLHLSILSISVCILVMVMIQSVSAQVAPVLGLSHAFFKSDHAVYPIQYNLTNAILLGTLLDLPAKALLFTFNATEDGQLTVELPRKIIDSTRNGVDTPYFVSLGNVNAPPNRIIADEIRHNNESRILAMHFTKGEKQVEIVGTYFIENNSTSRIINLWTYLPPLAQFNRGIDSPNVTCKQSFQLILKTEDGSPACVKPDTAYILMERGWAEQKEKSYHVYFPGLPPPVVDTRIGKIVSGIEEAQSIVGYHIGTLRYLPPGYSLQDILVDNSNSSKFVKILVSSFPVTQNTTSVEFTDNGGIMVYIEPTTPAFDQTNWISGWTSQTPGSSAIKIHGYDSVINDIAKGKRFDEEIDIPAELVILRNNTMVEISGFVNSDELIKIAEGVLES